MNFFSPLYNAFIFQYKRPYITDMDIFGVNHMFLTAYEIASKKVAAKPNSYTSNDMCFITAGTNKLIFKISNASIMSREFLR